MEFDHIPVLLQETLNLLDIKPDGIYVDCTLGGGGHSSEILKRLGKNGRLIGIDRDPEAIKAASERLSEFNNFTSVHANYAEIIRILEELDIEKVDGILMDLGVSSYQLDETSRGFTYNEEALLDMRMDTTQSFSAYDVTNNYTMEELTRIIRQYGEEKWARRIAEFIVKSRPVETTTQLVDVIKRAVPAAARKGGPHPARRTFQAIRIEVNQELELLQQSIMDSVDCLKSGGRLCIISFHSLEDRIVKNTFQQLYRPCKCPKDFPVCVCGLKQRISIVTKKPVAPKGFETEENPRARSAKLRVCEKL